MSLPALGGEQEGALRRGDESRHQVVADAQLDHLFDGSGQAGDLQQLQVALGADQGKAVVLLAQGDGKGAVGGQADAGADKVVGEDGRGEGGVDLLGVAAAAGLQEDIRQRQAGDGHQAGELLNGARLVRYGGLRPIQRGAGCREGQAGEGQGGSPSGGEDQQQLLGGGGGEQARRLDFWDDQVRNV